MNSRERMLAAITGLPLDYIPCSFMIFFNLRQRCASEAEFVAQQLAMGLDACSHVGYLRPALHPDATETVWTAQESGQTYYGRRIETPRGPLTQKVLQTEGWPTTESFWIFNDWVVPRAKEVLIKPEEDLEKLPYVLGPFRDAEIRKLRETAEQARVIARRHGLLQVGGWNSNTALPRSDDGVMGADAMAWLSGYADVMVLSLTSPDVIKEYMRLIHEWNLRQIQIYLDVTAADLILRRAWYETTEFWTPAAYRAIIAPFLKREVEWVHQAGKLFGLITTSAFMPLLDDILDTGIDVLIGLDPEEGKGTDLQEVKRRFQARGRSIWGGVSGAVTVEQGTAEQTESAVIRALDLLGRNGSFILSPVDNVRENTPNAWANTGQFIKTWEQYRKAFLSL
jgi:uroporphyrinogen-III decarboxylase